MRLALEQERKDRERCWENWPERAQRRTEQQALLSEREKQVQTFQQELQQRASSSSRSRSRKSS